MFLFPTRRSGTFRRLSDGHPTAGFQALRHSSSAPAPASSTAIAPNMVSQTAPVFGMSMMLRALTTVTPCLSAFSEDSLLASWPNWLSV